MSPISRFETIGVFISIAIMAVALGLLRFHMNPNNDEGELALDPNSQGAIVVAGTEDEDGYDKLANAISDSYTGEGQLGRLIIDDVLIGTGPEVEEGDTVTAHYIGSTQDGVQFDSSYLRGEPFTFTLGEGKVIEGWEKGLIGMKVGGQRILVVPSDMAYGNMKVGPIEAGSTLVFAIELLDIK